MLTPTAVLLLASYVGPVASPDVRVGVHPVPREERVIDRNEVEYINPEVRRAPRRVHRDEVMSEPERAEEGRMVVPRRFR